MALRHAGGNVYICKHHGSADFIAYKSPGNISYLKILHSIHLWSHPHNICTPLKTHTQWHNHTLPQTPTNDCTFFLSKKHKRKQTQHTHTHEINVYPNQRVSVSKVATTVSQSVRVSDNHVLERFEIIYPENWIWCIEKLSIWKKCYECYNRRIDTFRSVVDRSSSMAMKTLGKKFKPRQLKNIAVVWFSNPFFYVCV